MLSGDHDERINRKSIFVYVGVDAEIGVVGYFGKPADIPLLEKEGWLRGQRKDAKPPYSAQTGAKRERDSAKP